MKHISSIDRGDVKLAYDRAVAHDVEDVADMLEAFAEYIDRLEKQRDELLEQVECSNITEKNMEVRLNKLIVQNAATKDRLDEHRDGRLSALEKLAVAEKQRDELLAALDVVREAVTRAHAGCAHVASGAHCNEARQLARASIRNLDTALLIIASVKEKK